MKIELISVGLDGDDRSGDRFAADLRLSILPQGFPGTPSQLTQQTPVASKSGPKGFRNAPHQLAVRNLF